MLTLYMLTLYPQPFQDTNAGGLETWPAHCQNPSSTSVALTKDKQLVIVDEEAQGKPQMVPKPKFLDQLESFLKKELRSLGVDELGPSELRLQVKLLFNVLEVNDTFNRICIY